ncbi:MAG TPA: PRC-barrel domain-containing protein, partial [Thermoleophilia bacterium]|nr:PRC-barrel domain-containing protein [Thermoleophilia bacterium]
MFFLSRLLGQTVRDVDGKAVGPLQDIVVTLRQKYPRVTTLVVRRGNRRLGVPWGDVASFEESGVLLRVANAGLSDYTPGPNELSLSGKVLDRQIVDTEGRKMIRVNDIQLARSGPSLRVLAVDVSSNAILRRIGLGRVTTRVAKNPKPKLIDWSAVDLESSDAEAVRLTVPRKDLSLLHPADIAEIAHELTPEERAAVFEALEDEVAADTLEEMHPTVQASLLTELPDEKAADLLDEVSPDDAADLLADL